MKRDATEYSRLSTIERLYRSNEVIVRMLKSVVVRNARMHCASRLCAEKGQSEEDNEKSVGYAISSASLAIFFPTHELALNLIEIIK